MKVSQANSPAVVSLRVRLRLQRIKTLTMLACLLALFAIPASAATGTLYASGLNIPIGILWMGSSDTTKGVLHGHVWIADATSFCRLDQNAAGQFATSATCANLAGAIPSGQPDWDSANNFVFVPTDQGILRYTFNPSLNNPALEAVTGVATNLGQPGVLAIAFGPDKKLYFGGLKDSLVHRLTTPEGRTQTIEDVGDTAGTHPGAVVGQSVFGMAFQGSDLYLNTKNFLQRIVAASVFCNGGCFAEDLNINIAAVGSNRSTQVYFGIQGISLPPGQLSELVDSYDSTTQATSVLSAAGTSAAGPLFYAALHQMTTNAQTQDVYILDDQNLFPGGDLPPQAGQGRVIKLAGTTSPSPIVAGKPFTGTAPLPDGPSTFINPVSKSVAPALPGRSATIQGNLGSLTAPGILVINGDIWALDALQGICKANGGSIDPRTCVAVGIPGQSAFDAVNNLVYVPDKSANSAGVWRIPYSPNSRTLNGAGAQLVAANKGLGGNQPVCASLGPDGSLYVSFFKNGSVLQITAPNTTTNTVTQVAQSNDGHGISSLAWITRNVTDGFGNKLTFHDLYMLESTSLTYSASAITGTKAKGNLTTTAQITNPTIMVSDGNDTLYLGVAGEIDRYVASTSNQSLYAIGTNGPPVIVFGKITGLDLDPARLLMWIGDDPSGDASPGQGRMWQLSTK